MICRAFTTFHVPVFMWSVLPSTLVSGMVSVFISSSPRRQPQKDLFMDLLKSFSRETKRLTVQRIRIPMMNTAAMNRWWSFFQGKTESVLMSLYLCVGRIDTTRSSDCTCRKPCRLCPCCRERSQFPPSCFGGIPVCLPKWHSYHGKPLKMLFFHCLLYKLLLLIGSWLSGKSVQMKVGWLALNEFNRI